MNYSIIPTHQFEKELKRLVKKFPSLKNEFALLINEISSNPTLGVFLGNNCYKVRLAIASKGKGKSGGARIITYLYIEMQVVYLLTIYDKGEKSDVKNHELEELINSLELDI
ncbi:MAG: type II toxin-antitoxin system RelE/ParE family toxin [Chitinophagales bacterium]|nr:type II toxin-antitoxin system RelE/ParE family toxin [Chitinophagales bacterium]